ncbi:MAG: CPBP family glutamic-type intramembrane protease [Nitrospirales bacterium]
MASISWMGYILWQVWQNPTKWRSWGFRTDNLREAFIWPSVLFAGSGLVMAWYGVVTGRELWQGHMLFLLFLYPLWGILQQFLVQALGVDNLIKIFPQHGLLLAIPIGVILFAVVHFPDGWLMLATGLMACFFIPFYVRDRNLWPLGLYHGWLGTFFYLWVLDRDPWVSVFGR